jgi:uncharacterized protein YbaR (Trm112 family)
MSEIKADISRERNNYSAVGGHPMPRLVATATCPKCNGPLKREPTLFGAVYVCQKCDDVDPIAAGTPWLNGELQPPQKDSA